MMSRNEQFIKRAFALVINKVQNEYRPLAEDVKISETQGMSLDDDGRMVHRCSFITKDKTVFTGSVYPNEGNDLCWVVIAKHADRIWFDFDDRIDREYEAMIKSVTAP